MRNFSIVSLMTAILLTATSASALTLSEGKKRGLVGETASGYLAPVVSGTEAKQLVQEINAKRKQAYQQIAQKNGSALEAVEQIGGKEAIEKAEPGTFVQLPSGEWRKK